MKVTLIRPPLRGASAFGEMPVLVYRAHHMVKGTRMLFILEILFLLAGIWVIVSGQVPSFLVGGGKYQVEAPVARFLGVLLILPLPIAFQAPVVLVLLFGEGSTRYAWLLEIVAVLGVAVSVLFLVRVFGERVEPASDIEAVGANATKDARKPSARATTASDAKVVGATPTDRLTTALNDRDWRGT